MRRPCSHCAAFSLLAAPLQSLVSWLGGLIRHPAWALVCPGPGDCRGFVLLGAPAIVDTIPGDGGGAMGRTAGPLRPTGPAAGQGVPPAIALRNYFAVPSLRFLFSLKSSEAEFTQKRRPVGRGPSSKTWPRCAPQRAQRISSRCMPWLLSPWVRTFSLATGWKKLGQPVPESNLASEVNRGSPQQTHS